MTPKQEALFKVWIVAEGLATLMTPEELLRYWWENGDKLPSGLCMLWNFLNISSLYFPARPDKKRTMFWWPADHWRIRADFLLEEIIKLEGI